ncbi:MAG: hypothetical protein ABI658_20255 [Acidimicrobiales bacterium]
MSSNRAKVLTPLALGFATTVLTAIGLAGLGDAPNPREPATEISRYFAERRDEELLAAPFAYLGAIALVVFAITIAARLRREGESGAATSVTVGGWLCAVYFTGLHVVLTTLVYEPTATSADTTKTLFVATILAAPLLGTGVAALLGGFAWGDRSARVAPRWLMVASAVGAVAGLLALVSFAERGFWSPDVQQQISGNVILLWPLITGAGLAWRARSS